jgi:AcrR family transcriptional regulator
MVANELSPRDRLVAAARALFYAEGIHSVGVERILADAEVTRATMYRHFAGKEGLVVAYLEQEDADLRAMFAAARAATDDPKVLLETVIGAMGIDIEYHHTRGCPFINASAEYPDESSTVREVVDRHRRWFRAELRGVLTEAGITDPDASAASLVLLRDAALVGGYLDGVAATQAAFTRTVAKVLDVNEPPSIRNGAAR